MSVALDTARAAGVLRMLCYLLFGLLPALPLALLALLLPWQTNALAALLLLGAWLGTAGLLRAVLVAPARGSRLGNLIGCALLLAGVVAITPVLAPAVGTDFSTRQPGLFAIMCGPVVMALHYLVRVGQALYRNGDRTGLYLFAGLVFAGLLLPAVLQLTRPTPPPSLPSSTLQIGPSESTALPTSKDRP